jgi:hypothetical protein
MSNNTSHLEYFCTIEEDNKFAHYFTCIGSFTDSELKNTIKNTVFDLNASDYYIVKNIDGSIIDIIIICSTQDWRTTILHPVFTTTTRRLSHAQ